MRVKMLTTVVAGAVLALALVGGIVAGVAQARPGEQPAPPGQQRQERAEEFLDRLAQNLGVSPERLREALRQTALQQVDAAVAAGRLTPEQAERARERINAGNFGPFGPRGERAGPGRGLRLGIAQIARECLGITPAQLADEVRGRSLAEVAGMHGQSREQLRQCIVASVQQRVAGAVGNGRLTQQQADRMLARLEERVDELINRVHTPVQQDQPDRPGRRGRNR